MIDSQLNEAERRRQDAFSRRLAGSLLVGVAVLAGSVAIGALGDRLERPPAAVAVDAAPVHLESVVDPPLRLVGAWRLTANDPRFGGLSALAFTDGGLMALTDNGAIVRFPLPTARRVGGSVVDLPAGPGSPNRKVDRDSEALAPADGGGWWVAFEQHHQIWRFDPSFGRAMRSVRLPSTSWGTNAGIEAMIADGRDLWAWPEAGAQTLRLTSRGTFVGPGPGIGRVSEAVALGPGRALLLARSFGWSGFRHSLALIERRSNGWRVTRRWPLRLGRLDNAEGMAIEPRPGGGRRLWIVTDDNFRAPMRTVLLAIDWPRESGPAS